jgi:hypothetical protein
VSAPMARSRREVSGGMALTGSPGVAAAFRNELRDASGPQVGAVVLGYAETATGLGYSVADALGGAHYLHSTRRPIEGVVS